MSVYFAQAGEGGPIKIGHATNVDKRLASIQTGNPEPIRLLGVMPEGGREAEACLHARFAEHHLRGEWFAPAPDLLEFAADPRLEIEIADVPPAAAALQEAVARAGGQSALARIIGVTQQALWFWLHRSGRCKAEFALRIEQATGVRREKLRPDLFPESEAA